MYHWGLINWEFIDFVTSLKDISASKIHDSSWDICVHVETSYFFISQNILGTTEKFRNRRNFFQVLLSTILCKKSGTFSETFRTWNSVHVLFSQKKSWLLCNDKSQVQKNVDAIACFFCTIRKQKFKRSQAYNLITKYEFSHK